MDFKKNINGLRAWAVAIVVLYHFKVPGFSAGFMGVDIFFVISGFLITGALLRSVQEGRFSVWRFYQNRLRRIGPALALLTVVTVVAFGFLMLPLDYTVLIRSQLSALSFVSNLFYRSQAGYFDAATDAKPLIHTWSLSVEWQFYLLLPLLLWLGHRLRISATGLLLGLAAASFGYSLYASYVVPVDAFYLLPSRIWEFVAGGLLAVRPGALLAAAGRASRAASLAGVMLLGAALWVGGDVPAFPGWVALLPVMGAALVIAQDQPNRVNHLLSLRPLQFIGNISYSLYLWHWPVFVWMAMTAPELITSTAGQALGIGASVALASLTYRWVEVPTRGNKALWSDRRLVAAYLGLLLLVLALVAVANRTRGLPFRLPAHLARAEYAVRDVNPRRDECFIERSDARVHGPLRLCRIGAGESSAPSLMLWGDSFADALQVAVDEAARGLGVSGQVATVSGCAPIDEFPFADPAQRARFPACASDFNRRILQQMRQDPQLRTVVMAANWALYDEAILVRKVPQTVCELRRQGKAVVLFGVVPSAASDVPRAWSERQRAAGGAVEEMTVPADAQQATVAKFNKVAQQIASQCQGVTIIDPMAQLCHDGACAVVHTGVAYYHDQWHLSTHGAGLFVAPLQRALSPSAGRAERQ